MKLFRTNYAIIQVKNGKLTLEKEISPKKAPDAKLADALVTDFQ